MNANDNSNLTKMLRSEEFTFVGLCANGSVRVGCRGAQAHAIQFPVTHTRHSAMVELSQIASADDFESAVMSVLAGVR